MGTRSGKVGEDAEKSEPWEKAIQQRGKPVRKPTEGTGEIQRKPSENFGEIAVAIQR
jgi:hypothetical protein